MAEINRDGVTAGQQHTEAEEEMLNNLYASLEPDARLMYVNFFLARTPEYLQDDMKDLVQANFPNPPDAPEADIENLGAPRHQRVDVEAIAQAAGHAAGADEARAAREQALAARTLNPGNPNKPLVNIEPGPDGPIIKPGDGSWPAGGSAPDPSYQTTVLTPPHPEQISDTPAVAPDNSPLPDAYEPPRRY